MTSSESVAKTIALSEHIDTFIEMMAALVQSTPPEATAAEEPDVWALMSVARGLERLHTMRSEFDNLLVNKLRSPAGIKAVGTGNTTRFLVDQLGISLREPLQRLKAAELDGDLEPEDDRGGDQDSRVRRVGRIEPEAAA